MNERKSERVSAPPKQCQYPQPVAARIGERDLDLRLGVSCEVITRTEPRAPIWAKLSPRGREFCVGVMRGLGSLKRSQFGVSRAFSTTQKGQGWDLSGDPNPGVAISLAKPCPTPNSLPGGEFHVQNQMG